MKVELVSRSDETAFEDCMNKTIASKKIKDIKFTHFVGHDNVGIFSALIIYDE